MVKKKKVRKSGKSVRCSARPKKKPTFDYYNAIKREILKIKKIIRRL